MLEGKKSIATRTRRDFITVGPDHDTAHIASLLVQAWPRRIAAVERLLAEIPGVESHGPAGAGKLIITVDAEDDTALMEAVSRIEKTDGVITASLVYHHGDQGGGHD